MNNLKPLSRRNIQATPHQISGGDFLFTRRNFSEGGFIKFNHTVDFFLSHISFKTTVMNAIETKDSNRNIRIDFAPMVDLGFLLITFFVFTTSLMEQKAFVLHVPDEGTGIESLLSATITLTLKKNGAVDYAEGNETHVLAKGTAYLYGKPSLRDHLISKRQRIIKQLGTDEQYTVIIQPTQQTNYKEVVDVLDEMNINDIKKYVLLTDKPLR